MNTSVRNFPINKVIIVAAIELAAKINPIVIDEICFSVANGGNIGNIRIVEIHLMK